jgi:acyl-CoA reductase-like NAD-dependent aldehyde dehydrogenase
LSIDKIKGEEMKILPMIIGGKTVFTEKVYGVINPANGEVFVNIADGDATHIDMAVNAARLAFPAWSNTPEVERQKMLHEIAFAIEAHMPELMELVTKENGKPLNGLNGVGSGMEVGGSVAWTHVTADLELPIEILQDNDEARIEIHRKPLGVVGSITPWNWPLLIAIWQVIPALRAGNTVVLKPSALTPVATLRFVELANSILPAGVLNIVTGNASAGLGPAMAKHPGIDKIVFTGSTAVGKKVMENATVNLKRLTLELGGNDAGIVLPDVDPKAVAQKIFGVTFHNNGQTCACLKRLYVHESIYEELCKELVIIANKTIVGDGLLPETELGPVQNEKQLAQIVELADFTRTNGGRFLCGGHKKEGKGYFFEPTIVADVTDGDRLVDEEPFGPILPVIKYSDIDEVIIRANNSPNGLGGSIWSKDIEKATQIARRLECGSAWVNEHGALQPNAPFGGIKQSGIGVEFGRYGLEEYTTIQTLKIMKS